LHELYERLCQTISPISGNFEIIFINDDSPDASWRTINQIAELDSRVIGLNLSRNFGQHNAITAGLDWANGKWIVVMDCDLQDVPEEILKLYTKAQEGYDIVLGRRYNRQDSYLKKMQSILFFKVFNYLSGSDINHEIANFCIISNVVVKEFRKMNEQNRNFPLFLKWLGFKTTDIQIQHAKRNKGGSSYTIKKLLKLAIDTIVSHSNKPLRFSIFIGFSTSILSFIYGLYLFVRYFFYSIPVEGWTSLMVSLYFISGMIFANLGIIGLYIGKVFDETKQKPIYIVKETTHLK
jgi:polyisoprenyl-phosphate glycosyltransferase